jgi:hypothetical protein
MMVSSRLVDMSAPRPITPQVMEADAFAVAACPPVPPLPSVAGVPPLPTGAVVPPLPPVGVVPPLPPVAVASTTHAPAVQRIPGSHLASLSTSPSQSSSN